MDERNTKGEAGLSVGNGGRTNRQPEDDMETRT